MSYADAMHCIAALPQAGPHKRTKTARLAPSFVLFLIMRLCAVCALLSRAYLSIVDVVSCFCEVLFDCLGICLLSMSFLVFAKFCSIAWVFVYCR